MASLSSVEPIRPLAPVTLIVPLRNDVTHLAALLDKVASWSQAPAEIIVVATTTHTGTGTGTEPGTDTGEGTPAGLAALSRQHGVTLMVRDGTRGARLAAAARTAVAPVLWFVHADADPDPCALEHINATIAGGADAGCFRFRFQGGRTLTRRVLEACIAIRIRCGGIAYGDQGLFVKRDTYEACGGHTDQPLFEEARWVHAVRARGGFRILATPIGVSARRWERDGWLMRTLHNRWLAIRYMLGAPADSLARAYRQPLRENRELRR